MLTAFAGWSVSDVPAAPAVLLNPNKVSVARRETQRSDAKSSVDDLGAGRGVVHGRAVPNSHCDLLRLSPLQKDREICLARN